MSLRNLFFAKKKNKLYLAFDVGTHSIRSLSLEYGPEGAIGLKKNISLLPSTETNDGTALKTVTRLREIILRYIRKMGNVPDEVLLGVASNLTFNTLGEAERVRKDKNKSIKPEEINEILNQFVEDHKDLERNSEKFVLAHAEPVHLTIDGYDLDPRQLRKIYGSTIKLHISLNYARDDLWQEIEGLKKMLSGLSINVRPSHMAVAAFLIYKNPKTDFLLIKIGGKITEVSGVKEGVLIWTESFSVGGEDITKNIANSLKITLPRAEDIKKQYETFIMPENITDPAKKIINTTAENWIAELRKLILSKQFLLPEKIYLYGGGAKLTAIRKLLEEKTWARDLTYKESVEVKLLAAEDLTMGLFVNQPLRGPEDVGLAALVLMIIA